MRRLRSRKEICRHMVVMKRPFTLLLVLKVLHLLLIEKKRMRKNALFSRPLTSNKSNKTAKR